MVHRDRELDLAWAAGMLSSTGTLKSMSGGRYYRLEIRRTQGHRLASLEKFLMIFSEVPWKITEQSSGGRRVDNIGLQGEALHGVLEELWPYLDDDRKLELIMRGLYDDKEKLDVGTQEQEAKGGDPGEA